MTLDFHVHLGQATYPKFPADPDQALREMDQAGVERAVVFPQFNLDPGDYSAQNRWLARLCAAHPDRFLGFGRVNCWLEGAEKIAEEALSRLGLRGLKVNASDDNLETAIFLRVAEVAATHRKPLLFHGPLPAADQACERFPETPIILAHFGGPPLCEPGPQLLKRRPNAFLETSTVIFPGWIAAAAGELGAGRILLGSNFPTGDFAWAQERVRLALLAEADYRQIAGGNALRLLGEQP
jgi:hypothetical protein